MSKPKNEYDEACRLAFKFFPEATFFSDTSKGLFWENFLLAMTHAELSVDWSCDPFSKADVSTLKFYEKYKTAPESMFCATGGFQGTDKEIYCRLLKQTGITPSGRGIVIPEATSKEYFSQNHHCIIICDSSKIPQRLRDIDKKTEVESIFNGTTNILFVFESGSVILVDHDERIYWANSKIRNSN